MKNGHAVGPAVQRLFNKGVIRKDRLKLEISQKNFAKMLGVSPYILRTWENGKKMPDLDQVLEVHKVLGALKASSNLHQ